MRKEIFILFFSLFLAPLSFAQRFSEESLRNKLDSLAAHHSGLNNQLQLNVSSLQLSELVNSVALENNLNISIDPSLEQRISYNFYDAQVKDMLVFIYLNFEVEYEFIGSIISITTRKEKAAPPKQRSKPDVKYNPANKFLSMDLKNDTLWMVTEEITRITGHNFVLDPSIRDKVVNAYFLNRPYGEVLKMFAESNELVLNEEVNYFSLRKGAPAVVENPVGPNGKPTKPGNYQPDHANGDFILQRNNVGTLDVFARNVDLAQLIQAAADETGVHYILYSDIKGKANLDLTDVRFDELVQRLFEGTEFTMRDENGLYVIGENKNDGFRATELVRLENRTIESVKAAIPKDMLIDVEVLEFNELNGLIITGGQRKIDQLKTFIASIDMVVPMVQIDVMLLYSEKSTNMKTGIEAGVKDTPTATSGTVFPAFDMNLGAGTINGILDAINGFGVVNLGQVTENFYVSLSALEENGVIDIQSTPKISTLNGHEANISIGELTHYQQTQVNVQTSVTQQGVVQTQQWTPIDASLAVKIKPFVSADEHVTLTITVEQNEFAGKASSAAPPDMDKRKFESMVRVRNGEMILLGGLEKKTKLDNGSGVPILSRIPILKWIFSSRTKNKAKSKLHILIRPIVTY